MAMTAAIGFGALALGTNVYSTIQQGNARSDAQAAAAAGQAKQNQLIDEATRKQKQQEQEANTAAMNEAQQYQRQIQAQAAGGRSGTILTSPLGITTPTGGTASKTLLGM